MTRTQVHTHKQYTDIHAYTRHYTYKSVPLSLYMTTAAAAAATTITTTTCRKDTSQHINTPTTGQTFRELDNAIALVEATKKIDFRCEEREERKRDEKGRNNQVTDEQETRNTHNKQRSLLIPAAEGNAEAQYKLANCYRDGYGVSISQEEGT